jgi:hypothetical protein
MKTKKRTFSQGVTAQSGEKTTNKSSRMNDVIRGRGQRHILQEGLQNKVTEEGNAVTDSGKRCRFTTKITM